MATVSLSVPVTAAVTAARSGENAGSRDSGLKTRSVLKTVLFSADSTASRSLECLITESAKDSRIR